MLAQGNARWMVGRVISLSRSQVTNHVSLPPAVAAVSILLANLLRQPVRTREEAFPPHFLELALLMRSSHATMCSQNWPASRQCRILGMAI